MAFVLACASGPTSFNPAGITPEQLLAGRPLGTAPGASPVVVTEAEVLALSPEMRAFLDAHVDRRGSDSLKVRQLVGAIFNPDIFGLHYDEHTRTASETFRTRRGNCLSFSTMFVVMARHVGLRAEFQEVDIPPDWSLDKDTLVLNRHVDVRVKIEPAGTLVVDFNVADFRASYDMRTISDTRALAHYANNVGFERMQVGDTAAALAYFRAAIVDSDRRFSPAWTNLGTLYLRSGQLAWAEAAYLQALRADRTNLVAMSNLTHVYERQGNLERVERTRRRVTAYRWRNPYYRYQLARQAFADAQYETAISHLTYAIRHKRNEDRFYTLLGECYQREGNERAAQRWLDRARKVAASQTLQDAYPDH
jgi:Flp pilus assembly protein TadD